MDYVARQTRLRRRFMKCVTESDFDYVVHRLIQDAKGGDKSALKMFLEYCLGKPTQAMQIEGSLKHEHSAARAVQEAMGRVLSDPQAFAAAESLAQRLSDPSGN